MTEKNKDIIFTYQELVDIQSFFIEHNNQNKPQMEMQEAVLKIGHLFQDTKFQDRNLKGMVAIWFLYEVDTGDWQINNANFTYLKCKVKLNKIRRGASLNNSIKYQFILEE